MPLDHEIAALLEKMKTAVVPKIGRDPVEAVRANMLRVTPVVAPQNLPTGGIEDITIAGPGGPLKLRLYIPAGVSGTTPAIVFFHGGGWVLGDLDTHDAICRQLANASGCRVVAVDYRLAPEHACPAALDDAVAAIRWIRANGAGHGIDASQLALAGDSAGANLSACATLRLRANGEPQVSYQALFYPCVQKGWSTGSMQEFAEGYVLEAESMKWFWNTYAGHLPDDHPDHSPLASDLDGLAPALVVTAGYDPLRDEGKAYAQKLKAAGVAVEHVNYEGAVHGFFRNGALVALARTAIDHAGRKTGAALTGK